MKPKLKVLAYKSGISTICIILLLSGLLFTFTAKEGNTEAAVQVAEEETENIQEIEQVAEQVSEELEDTREDIEVTSRGEVERVKPEYTLYQLVIKDGEQTLTFDNIENAESYKNKILTETNNLEVSVIEIQSFDLEGIDSQEVVEDVVSAYIAAYHKPTTHFPAVSHTVSSKYGQRTGDFHTGIDLCGSYGENIYAYKAGTVIKVQYSNSSYGNMILIQHNDGIQTRYAHLSSIKVQNGESVSCGQVIGGMGATGNATGVHLHFEVIISGSTVNPYNYIF